MFHNDSIVIRCCTCALNRLPAFVQCSCHALLPADSTGAAIPPCTTTPSSDGCTRCNLPPVAVVMMHACRWRLHLDADSSIGTLLEAAAAAAAAGACNHGQRQQQQQPQLGDVQLRTRDPATGRTVVQFGSPQAAALALGAAAEVAAAAGSSGPVGSLVAAASRSAEQQQQQHPGADQQTACAGGWLVDLLHAAVHRAIALLS